MLYCLMPFDKSPLGQFKDPVFWYFTFVSFVSCFAARIFFFVILLLFLSWDARGFAVMSPDDYQVVSFISRLKGTVFVTSGVCMSIYATFGYWRCVKIDGSNTCAVDGPAIEIDLFWQAIDFFGCCVLAWLAFLFLLTDRTARTGWHTRVGSEELRHKHYVGHGGYMRHLFWYDVACVGCSLMVFLGVGWKDAHTLHSKHRAFFFSKMLYGLLSAPFLLFRLPFVSTFLCHTSATGYNENGECVPFMLRPKKT